MLIIGYCFGIRSERRLCDEVHRNMAYRWFCRLGLDGSVPDHSTVLQRCIDAGLVGGEGFAVDASLIHAEASDRNRVEGTAGLPPTAAGRAGEEYLATLDDAAFGAAGGVMSKLIAPSDPPTRWTAAHRGPAFFAYSNNYVIDVDNAIIVDVEATTATGQAEILAAKRMIERSIERFDLSPARLIKDSAYGSAEILYWLVHDHAIEPHVPVFDKSKRTDDTFSREDFTYDHGSDTYRCPAWKALQHYRRRFTTPRTGVPNDNLIRYRTSTRDCGSRPLKPRCCPNAPARKVLHSIHESARDLARDIANTEAYQTSRRPRKKVEMLFAHPKRILKLDRLRLRGPCEIVKPETFEGA
jgi:Transposase domain (DUF772)/Transposase DDE domain